MDALYLFEISLGLIIAVLGWNVKTLFNRIERGEERVETLRKDLYQEMKDIYTKHDQATDSLRGEMNKMAISLRNAISDSSNRTNELLVKVISKND